MPWRSSQTSESSAGSRDEGGFPFWPKDPPSGEREKVFEAFSIPLRNSAEVPGKETLWDADGRSASVSREGAPWQGRCSERRRS